LTTDQVAVLTTADIVALKTSQIAALSTTQINQGLTTDQIVALTTAQIVALTTAQVSSGLTSSQVAALTTTQIMALTVDQKNALPLAEFQLLNIVSSPIVLDLTGLGIQTQSIAAGTMFDLNNTGTAVHTGWVTSGDGLLVIDRNNDGVINNGSELFGTATQMTTGGTAANGYAALAQMDTNGDGVISAADSGWSELKVWVDSNGDGISQSGELKSMASLGITQLNLAATVTPSDTNNGNIIGMVSSYTTSDGATHQMGDVWFANTGGITTSASIAAASITITQPATTVSTLPGVTTASALAASNLTTAVSGLSQALTTFNAAQSTGNLAPIASLGTTTSTALTANVGLIAAALTQFGVNGNPIAATTTTLVTHQVSVLYQSPVAAITNTSPASQLDYSTNNRILVAGK